MRTTREVLEEITSHVMPPRGIAIEIKEMASKESNQLALKVRMQRPEALIAYVRQQNKRGDARHPGS